MIDLERKDNENEEQYLWRLGTLKDSGKIDIGWNQIAEYVNKYFRTPNDRVYSESAYRKPFQQAKRFYDAGVFAKYTDDNSRVSEIRDSKIELVKERAKLQTAKIELNRLIRQQSRFEMLYENIANSIAYIEPPEFQAIPIADNEKCYVVGIGDIHYGANFRSENNAYSRQICKERFEKLLAYLKRYVLENKISNLKIVNVADSIQGIIRISDLQMNDTSVVQCVVEISQIIASFLNQLSSVCNVEYYHVSQANHSQTRNLGTKASELAGEDLEKIIANYIHDVLASNNRVNVIFDTNQDHLDFDIFDFHCTAEHGNKVKNVNTYLKDKRMLRDKSYSYAFLGHTHASQEIIVGEGLHNNIELLIIPSFIGSDPYADILNVGAKAMSKIYIFDKQYGHIGSQNIILN